MPDKVFETQDQEEIRFAAEPDAPWAASANDEPSLNTYTQTELTLESDGNSVTVHDLQTTDSSGYYKKEETKKEAIVLHFTAGAIRASIGELTRPDTGVSVPYVVARDGRIYRLFEDRYWAYHLGKGAAGGNEDGSKRSIGIEIVNLGPLIPDGQKLLTSTFKRHFCDLADTKAFVKLGAPFRERQYFATFTDAQYESLKKLIKYLCAEHDIPREFLAPPQRYDLLTEDAAKKYRGIASHVNFRGKDGEGKWVKWDIGPAFEWGRIAGSGKNYALPVDIGMGTDVTDKNVTEYFRHIDFSRRGGYFPMGSNTTWHGGVHLHVDEGMPVVACSAGTIVAARLADKVDKAWGAFGSRNFILVKHELPPLSGSSDSAEVPVEDSSDPPPAAAPAPDASKYKKTLPKGHDLQASVEEGVEALNSPAPPAEPPEKPWVYRVAAEGKQTFKGYANHYGKPVDGIAEHQDLQYVCTDYTYEVLKLSGYDSAYENASKTDVVNKSDMLKKISIREVPTRHKAKASAAIEFVSATAWEDSIKNKDIPAGSTLTMTSGVAESAPAVSITSHDKKSTAMKLGGVFTVTDAAGSRVVSPVKGDSYEVKKSDGTLIVKGKLDGPFSYVTRVRSDDLVGKEINTNGATLFVKSGDAKKKSAGIDSFDAATGTIECDGLTTPDKAVAKDDALEITDVVWSVKENHNEIKGVAWAIVSSNQGKYIPDGDFKALKPGDFVQYWPKNSPDGHSAQIEKNHGDGKVDIHGSHKGKNGITVYEKIDLSTKIWYAARPTGNMEPGDPPLADSPGEGAPGNNGKPRIFYSLYMHLNHEPLDQSSDLLERATWLWKEKEVALPSPPPPPPPPPPPAGAENMLKAKKDGTINDKAGKILGYYKPGLMMTKKGTEGSKYHVSFDPADAKVQSMVDPMPSEGYVTTQKAYVDLAYPPAGPPPPPPKPKTKKVYEPDQELMDKLAKGDVVKVDAPVKAGQFLWSSGAYGGDTPKGVLHFELFSEENIFPDWPVIEDTDGDYNMDCQSIVQLLEQEWWGSDEVLTEEEISVFFETNPEAVYLRRMAYKFVIEWGIDLGVALPKLKGGYSTDGLEELIKPYLWWTDAKNAGVALPKSTLVWHYHPVAALEFFADEGEPSPPDVTPLDAAPVDNVYAMREGKKVPHFCQGDSRWGSATLGSSDSISASGCAISSLSMVLKYYGRDVDPKKMDKHLDDNDGYVGDGVKWGKAFDYGKQSEADAFGYASWKAPGQTLKPGELEKTVDEMRAEIRRRIDRQIPTILHVDYKKDNDTSGNHFIVAVGYTPEGDIIINDPASGSGSGADHPGKDNVLETTTRGSGYSLVRIIPFTPPAAG